MLYVLSLFASNEVRYSYSASQRFPAWGLQEKSKGPQGE